MSLGKILSTDTTSFHLALTTFWRLIQPPVGAAWKLATKALRGERNRFLCKVIEITRDPSNSSNPTVVEPRFHVPAQSNPMSLLKPGGAGGMSRLPRGCSTFAKYGMMDSHAGLIALSLGGC